MKWKGYLPDQEISQLSKLTMVGIFNCNKKSEQNQMSRLILYIKPSVLFLWQSNLLREATSPTFYNSPWCLPPQNSFSIHLIFFVAAHHSKGHRLLWTDTFQHGPVCRRELHKVYEETNRKHAPVPWHSAWSKQRASVREAWSSLVFGKKWWDKCMWKKKQSHLLWSCHCRSCPPCPHQILSGGNTQSRPSPVPSLPTA